MAEGTRNREAEPLQWWQKDFAWIRRTFPDGQSFFGPLTVFILLIVGILASIIAEESKGLHVANWIAFGFFLAAFLLRIPVSTRRTKRRRGPWTPLKEAPFGLRAGGRASSEDMVAVQQGMKIVLSNLRGDFEWNSLELWFGCIYSALWCFKSAVIISGNIIWMDLIAIIAVISVLVAAILTLPLRYFNHKYRTFIKTLRAVDQAAQIGNEIDRVPPELVERIDSLAQKYRFEGPEGLAG